MPTTTVPPTVGRIVWFFERGKNDSQPLPAIVIRVSDVAKPLVNVQVFNDSDTGEDGTIEAFDNSSGTWLDVPLYDGPAAVPADVAKWCEWMPYQIEQARRHAAATA